MRFIDFFSCIYVLNLPERTDRLRHMQRELARLGMPFDLPKVRRFNAIKPETMEPFHKLGSKGCFLSILAILKTARQEGLQHILILQDDAQFLPEFSQYEPEIVQQLSQSHWTVAQFGYYPLPQNMAACEFVNTPPRHFGALVPYTGELIGAHCFAVRGQQLTPVIAFLEGLLSRPPGHPLGGPMPIDGAFNVLSQQQPGTRWVLTPSLVRQISSRSDVTPSRYDRHPALRPLVSVARQLGLVQAWRRRP